MDRTHAHTHKHRDVEACGDIGPENGGLYTGVMEDREELLLDGEEAEAGSESGHCDWSIARMDTYTCKMWNWSIMD